MYTLLTMFQMKCLKYWPDIDHTVNFGPYSITLTTQNVYDSYTLRTISLKYEVCKILIKETMMKYSDISFKYIKQIMVL